MALSPKKIQDLANQFRQQVEPQITLMKRCSSFFVGRQDIGLPTVGIGYNVASPVVVSEAQFNLIQAYYRNTLARLVTDYPSAVVMPMSPAPDDIRKAEASEGALQYFWAQKEMDAVLAEHSEWLLLRGTSALLTCAQGEDVYVEAIDPEYLRAEPGIRSPAQSRFLAVVRHTTKDELLEQFPDKAEIIEEYAHPVIEKSITVGGTDSMPPDRVEVLEAYTKEGKGYIILAGQVLEEIDVPGKEIPIQISRFIQVPGSFFGMGLVELVIESQNYFNNFMNQIMRNMRLSTNPKVMVNRDSNVSADAFTSEVAEIVEYDGQLPTPWVPAPVPQTLMQMPAMLQALMQDLLSLHSASRGGRVAGDPSGVAIEAMQAADSLPLDLTEGYIVKSVRKTARTVLCYMKAYYPEAKFTRQLDKYGKLVWGELQKTSLVDDPEVIIEANSLFRSNAVARDQKTMALLKAGIITPKQAQKLLSQHLDPNSPLTILADLRHAQDLLDAQIGTGLPAQIYPTDNLEVIEEVYQEYMRSPDFYKMDVPTQQTIANTYQQVVMMLAGTPLAPPPGTDGQTMPGQPPVLPPPPMGGASLSPPTMPGQEQAENAVGTAEVTSVKEPSGRNNP